MGEEKTNLLEKVMAFIGKVAFKVFLLSRKQTKQEFLDEVYSEELEYRKAFDLPL